ncbi:DciA family protein (plasmid) [Streptomyces sp. BI20]|uniref:DciA family protein n=1 Tax=Streptomyces sp. BI20 TaxID=3403460 RepID=UPI003C761DCD
MTTPAPASGVDLARAALAAARAQARTRGTTPTIATGRARAARTEARGAGREPVSLMAALERLTAERGWERPVATAGVIDRWPDLVGEATAAGLTPVRHQDGVLHLRPASPAWAAELRYRSPSLLALLAQALGPGVVHTLTAHR